MPNKDRHHWLKVSRPTIRMHFKMADIGLLFNIACYLTGPLFAYAVVAVLHIALYFHSPITLYYILFTKLSWPEEI